MRQREAVLNASMGAVAAFTLTIRFKKAEHLVQLPVNNPSTGQLASAIASLIDADSETVKLLIPGKKSHMLRLNADSSQTAQDAGEAYLMQLMYTLG